MLPQGRRSVASPRVTRTAECVPAPSTVSPTAAGPHRRRWSGSAAGRGAGPLPAPTTSGVPTGRRPKASCGQNATTASEYSPMVTEKRVLDSAASDASGVTRGDLRFGGGSGSGSGGKEPGQVV